MRTRHALGEITASILHPPSTRRHTQRCVRLSSTAPRGAARLLMMKMVAAKRRTVLVMTIINMVLRQSRGLDDDDVHPRWSQESASFVSGHGVQHCVLG